MHRYEMGPQVELEAPPPSFISSRLWAQREGRKTGAHCREDAEEEPPLQLNQRLWSAVGTSCLLSCCLAVLLLIAASSLHRSKAQAVCAGRHEECKLCSRNAAFACLSSLVPDTEGGRGTNICTPLPRSLAWLLGCLAAGCQDPASLALVLLACCF